MVSGEENTFFLRAFEALGVTEDRRTADPDTQPTAGFKAIMREAEKRAAMPPRFRSSSWPNGSISTGPPARRSRCRSISCTPSGSRYTTIRGFAASSISCARSWTASAPHKRICAATFSSGPSPSNSPSSKPPTLTGPDIDVFDRVKAPSQRGTEGSNLRFLPARSLQRTLWLPGAAHAAGTPVPNLLPSSGELRELALL